jgi:hypothetical protein
MALPDMVVFNQYIQTETIELLGQMVEKFNAASNNSIVLSTTGFDGDYLQTSFWNQLPIARRVDRDATNDTEAATDLTQAQHNAVKVAGGFGPVLFEPGQLSWMQKDPAEAIRVSSEALANGIMADMLNTGIAAGVAAISNQAAATADTGASAELTYVNINSAHAKFGDASSMIVADIMDGASYHALLAQNLGNAEVLFEAGNVTVVNILGKAVVVTDAPALRQANPGKTSILGLVNNGIVVNDASDLITNTETRNGKLRIETTFQADYTFGLGLKGYAWDIANGGNSPLDAAIATGTNWDLVMADIKHTAGVVASFTTPA